MAGADFRDLAADLAGAGQRVRQQASVVVRQSALAVQNHAIANAAVDTGFMRSSVGMQSASSFGNSIVAQVTPTAYYSHFVEHGTIYMSAQPFMGPALEAIEPSFVAAMEQVGGDIL